LYIIREVAREKLSGLRQLFVQTLIQVAMKRIGSLLTIFFLMGSIVKGQNLIPNGGFENPRIFDCNDISNASNTIGNFFNTWYGNAWVYSDLCPSLFDKNHRQYRWRYSIPYAGKANAQLFVSSWDDGVFTPFGVATPLTQELEANEWYYLEMYVRNRGRNIYTDDERDCVASPAPQLQFYLSDEPIEIRIEADGTKLIDSYASSGYLAAQDSSSHLQTLQEQAWTRIATCFQARGGESHLAISPPLGTFNYASGCEATDSSNVYYSAFYELDEVLLLKIPEQVDALVEICQNESDTVFLDRLIPFANAKFSWPDGRQDAQRIIQQGGNYPIRVDLPCKRFELNLEVLGNDCSSKVFIPNAFTPNGDGINDEFGVSFQAFWPVNFYHFQVFNRWGNLVFESFRSSESWDGRIHGKAAPRGLYVWTLDFRLESPDSQLHRSNGSIHLLR